MQKIYKCIFDKEDKGCSRKIPNGAIIISITIGLREVGIYTLAEDTVEKYDTLEVQLFNSEKHNIDRDLSEYTYFNASQTYDSSQGVKPYFVWYKISETL